MWVAVWLAAVPEMVVMGSDSWVVLVVVVERAGVFVWVFGSVGVLVCVCER